MSLFTIERISMTIGIDASRAFLKRRTGIEEYAYQTIKHLRSVIAETDTVVLYVRQKLIWDGFRVRKEIPAIDFTLPENWQVRGIWAPRFWTQIALSLEMLWRSPDVLFVPAHTVPLIHPAKTIVTIHGLEYEFCKEAYPFWDRLYMRTSIRFSCRAAQTVICVSENTKRDVMRLYAVKEEKIRVIYEGYDDQQSVSLKLQSITDNRQRPYLLFIGRLEERKNIVRMIEAFEILKDRQQIPHQLVLIGKFGYGKEQIEEKIAMSRYQEDIVLPGYVSEGEKWQWLAGADVFLFPTLYEGFGIPVLEAQSVGVPVVTSATSSLPEVAGEGALYVDPTSAASIASGIREVLLDQVLREEIKKKATHNVNRFGWARCAAAIGELLR